MTTYETSNSQATAINENYIENLENNLANRLEQARQLREEQRQLEIMNAMHPESTADTETAQKIYQRRKAIEARLVQLTQTERWHRELIQRYQLRQRALANANAVTSTAGVENKIDDHTEPTVTKETESITKTTKTVRISCDPVRKFIATFRVSDPAAWLRENCEIIKQLYPTASCTQIQKLLHGCFFNH